MAGIPHIAHLRSTTLAGLSSVMLIFDDDSIRRPEPRAGPRAPQPGHASRQPQPQMGTDWSPVGQIYWYTLESTNPAYDTMELKSHRGLEPRKGLQDRRPASSTSPASAASPASTRSASIPTSSSLRPLHLPGRTAARQQQRQRRRKLHRAGHAANQRSVARPLTDVQDIAKLWSKPPTEARQDRVQTRHRRAGTQDPPRPDRPGDASHQLQRFKQHPRQSRRRRRHRPAPERRRRRPGAQGHSRRSRRAQRHACTASCPPASR